MKGPVYLVTIACKHFADKCNNEYYGITQRELFPISCAGSRHGQPKKHSHHDADDQESIVAGCGKSKKWIFFPGQKFR